MSASWTTMWGMILAVTVSVVVGVGMTGLKGRLGMKKIRRGWCASERDEEVTHGGSGRTHMQTVGACKRQEGGHVVLCACHGRRKQVGDECYCMTCM